MNPWGGHYRPRFPVQIMCAGCGDYFTAHRKDAKTCSPKCRKRLQRYVNGEATMEQILTLKRDLFGKNP